jgi:hypothetical protein
MTDTFEMATKGGSRPILVYYRNIRVEGLERTTKGLSASIVCVPADMPNGSLLISSQKLYVGVSFGEIATCKKWNHEDYKKSNVTNCCTQSAT